MRWVRHWTSAAPTEALLVRGWGFDDRGLKCLYQILSINQMEIRSLYEQACHVSRARDLSASVAVAELERASCALNLECHTAAEAAASDHVWSPYASMPSNV